MSGGFEATDTAIRVTRPDGLTDAEWAQARIGMERILTGHMPWCSDHEGDGGADYCRHEERGYAVKVYVHNGTDDGRTVIDFSWADGVREDSLSAQDADCASVVLERAAQLVRIGNTVNEAGRSLPK